MTSRRRLSLFYVVLVAGSAVLAVLVAEIFVRLRTDYSTPALERERLPKYETAVFARHVFARERDTIEFKNGSVIDINAKGYRGPDFAADKPPGTIRMMVYGGSSAFDPNAGSDQDWPRRIERLLREAGFPRVEVINAGIPAHSAADSLGRFFAEGHLFRPDYVLLYTAWNDMKLFRSDEPLLRRLKPFDKAADFRVSYRSWLDRVLCETSQLYVHLRAHYFSWKLDLGEEGAAPEGEFTTTIAEPAVRQYRLNVELFVDAARNVGAVPILMIEARLVAPGNTPPERDRISYDYQKMDHETLLRAYDRVDAVLRDVSSRKNVALIDASSMIGVERYFSDHVHVTGEGSAELARLAATALEPLLRAREDSAP